MATTNKVKGWTGVLMTEDSSSHWPIKRRYVYSETSRRAGLRVRLYFWTRRVPRSQGVTRALQHSTIPDHLTTVFAGVDREATERAREHMVGVAPSSPSVALFKDGELVHMLERRHIEMMNDEMVAQNLTEAFDKYCSRQGPSVLREEYEKMVHARQCGSSVPLFDPLSNH